MKTALLLLISGIAWGACASPPYANGYSFCREITIDHTKVTSTQTNFPMVVCFGTTMGSACSTNNRQLATAANGGKLLNASGYDVIFTSDNAGTAPMSYERAIQTLTTGDSEFWVLIASLSSSADTKIYLFYGNASISTDQSNPTAVWDANYIAVNHFNALSGNVLTVADSTSNGNGLTATGLPSTLIGGTGIIGGSAVWAGVTDLTDGTPSGLPTGSGTRTLEMWVKSTATGSNQTAMCIGTNAAAGRFSIFLVGSPNTWAVEGPNIAGSYPATVGSWHHIVLTLPGGATTYMGTLPYVDGALQTLSNVLNWTTTINTGAGDYRVGGLCNIGGSVLTSGAVADEARISNVARSADWIATEYNNQSSPNTFYSLSTQIPPDASSGRTIIIN